MQPFTDTPADSSQQVNARAPQILVCYIDPSASADNNLNRVIMPTTDDGDRTFVELNVSAPVL